jgi:hypothetical protein
MKYTRQLRNIASICKLRLASGLACSGCMLAYEGNCPKGKVNRAECQKYNIDAPFSPETYTIDIDDINGFSSL